ncbi:ANK1 [Symbiodinium natans]|uniref:ANK1 protein n=1 Tax=Symbiodinium natans TaxID=878477 RepID=A0A812SWC3_9DINO|nr:ANK1 [Symbiodinium natans]
MESEETILTHAGYPNPHRTAFSSADVGACQLQASGSKVAETKSLEEEEELQKSLTSRAAKAADAAVSARKDAADTVLSEQVLWRQAFISERQKAEDELAQEERDPEQDEAPDDGEALQRLLDSIVPCYDTYTVSIAQSADRQRVDGSSERWTAVKGQQLTLKPFEEDDCLLLVSNALFTPESDREGSHCLLKRDGQSISSTFSGYSRQRTWSHHVCLPWLDQPMKCAEFEYQVMANAGRQGCHVVIGDKKERRQFFGLTLPACQVAWVQDDEVLGLPPGPWRDVNGMHEVIATLPGEKVLVLCTMHYVANWSSELNRGRFTLVRDDTGLDGLADRGLQSVRSLGPNQARTLVMATVDEPPAGPHLYRVRAALTTGDESGVSATLQNERQLALVRLPGHLVTGPMQATHPIEVTEGSWTEIPGMSLTCSLRRPRDRILLVYHVDCSPLSHFYEAHFTIFRRKEASSAPAQNLGFSEDYGLDMVFSDYGASSEYPAALLVDTPGSLGAWTYYVAARVANLGTSRENPPVVVGYSGSISAVLLTR